MTAKAYLGQAFRLDQRINSKLEQIASLNELATKCTYALTGMPKNPSRSTSMMADAIAKIVDLQGQINHDIDLLVDLKCEIVSVIKNVDHAEYQTLLELFKPWEQIAVDMNYSIHRKALYTVSIPKILLFSTVAFVIVYLGNQNKTKPRGRNPPGLFSYAEENTMPYKAKKPCAHPGCRELTAAQYCEEHAKQEAKRYNQYDRNPDSNKRYGRAWKRIRDRYIKSHPLCEECEKQGRLTPTEEAHHILPLSKGGGNEMSNLMALCKSCHSRITAESGNRWGRSNL